MITRNCGILLVYTKLSGRERYHHMLVQALLKLNRTRQTSYRAQMTFRNCVYQKQRIDLLAKTLVREPSKDTWQSLAEETLAKITIFNK